MLDRFSPPAAAIFAVLAGILLALSFYLARRPRTLPHNWLATGLELAGNDLSAAWLLGIVGLIACYGYDGFLYAIGLFAGWVVALLTAPRTLPETPSPTAPSLITTLLFLIPEIVVAGWLLKPLLSLPTPTTAIILAGILILAAATIKFAPPWRSALNAILLLLICLPLTWATLTRGLTTKPPGDFPRRLSNDQFVATILPTGKLLAPTGGWASPDAPFRYVRLLKPDGALSVWQVPGQQAIRPLLSWPSWFIECQTLTLQRDGSRLVNGRPQTAENDLQPAGFIASLAANTDAGQEDRTGPLGPMAWLTAARQTTFAPPATDRIAEADGSITTIYFPHYTSGPEFLTAGNAPTLFPALKSDPGAPRATHDRLNFISLMLALFCGAATLPHLQRRPSAAPPAPRHATLLALAVLALLLIAALFLGLGALTARSLPPDPGASSRALPLLARSYGQPAFAAISALALVAILWTASAALHRAAGAPPRLVALLGLALAAIFLGILCQQINAIILAGWAFNITVSASLPALTIPRFWNGATPRALRASTIVGLSTSLLWILLSPDAFLYFYGSPTTQAALHASPLPFTHPALITLPLSFATLILVSLITPPKSGATGLAA